MMAGSAEPVDDRACPGNQTEAEWSREGGEPQLHAELGQDVARGHSWTTCCKSGAMSEGAPPSRRRERSRAARSTGPSLAPLPRVINRMPPVEVLTEEQIERILAAAFRIMEEGGLEIRS